MIHISNYNNFHLSPKTAEEDILKDYTDIYLLKNQLSFQRHRKRELVDNEINELLKGDRYNKLVTFRNKSYGDDITTFSISNHKIGIDIETIDMSFNYKELSIAIFSPQELAQLKPMTPIEFYKSWTRKEAILKFKNLGIIDEIQLIPSIDGTHNLPALDAFGGEEDLYVFSFVYENNVISICSLNQQESIRVILLER